MIAIKGMTMSKDCEGCISCAFQWNGDSTTYCLAQSHPYGPAEKRLHKINYDDPNNPYGGEEGLTHEEVYKKCITWRESTCPLIEVEPQESDIEKLKPLITKIANTMNVSEARVATAIDTFIKTSQPYKPIQGLFKSAKCSECDVVIRNKSEDKE